MAIKKKPNCSMIHHVCTYVHTYIYTHTDRIVMHVKAGTDKIERARVVSHLRTDTMYLSFDTSMYVQEAKLSQKDLVVHIAYVPLYFCRYAFVVRLSMV